MAEHASSVCQTFSIHFLHCSYLFNAMMDQVRGVFMPCNVGNIIRVGMLGSKVIEGVLLDKTLTLKELGFLDPSHSRGADSAPNLGNQLTKHQVCGTIVDSYDPPESIGTKKSTNIPCMTPQ